MKRTLKSLAIIAVFSTAGLGLACADGNSPEKVAPAEVHAIDGSDLKVLVLHPRAVERIAIETTSVSEQAVPDRRGDGEEPRIVVPYSTIIYGPEGETWVYINTEENTYWREPVVVDYVTSDLAILESGPPVGTTVVMVGAAELYGEETGVGK